MMVWYMALTIANRLTSPSFSFSFEELLAADNPSRCNRAREIIVKNGRCNEAIKTVKLTCSFRVPADTFSFVARRSSGLYFSLHRSTESRLYEVGLPHHPQLLIDVDH